MTTSPKMHAVESTNVHSIGHCGAHMHVRFKSGATYVYHDVPVETFEKCRASDSVGRFVNAHVKGKHTSKKLGDE